MKTLNKILFILLTLLSTVHAADEQNYVPENADSKAIVNGFNDEIRRTSRRLRDLEGGISLTTGVTGILPVANGGTGKDLSTAATGTIPYFSSTGVIGNIGIGTSGYVLTSNGSYPSFQPSNTLGIPVILRWGQIDSVTSSTNGITSSATLAATTVSDPESKYVFWMIRNGTYEDILNQEPVYFQKKANVTTISGSYHLWEQTDGAGGRRVSCYVDAGGQVSTTSTSSSSIPTSKSWSIDVSSLSNGQNYQIKVMCRDDVPAGNSTYGFVAKIIGFES